MNNYVLLKSNGQILWLCSFSVQLDRVQTKFGLSHSLNHKGECALLHRYWILNRSVLLSEKPIIGSKIFILKEADCVTEFAARFDTHTITCRTMRLLENLLFK